MKCCNEIGVPYVCISLCKPRMSRSNQPHSDDCNDWIIQINNCRKSTKLQSCCDYHQVPVTCSGVCRGSCGAMKWDLLISNSECDIPYQNLRNCCNGP